jgi:hypothetical protein
MSADDLHVIAEDLIELELLRNRFNRLMTELSRGEIARNSFQPWEVEILLDIEACELEPRKRLDTLRQYQKAVQKQMEHGNGPPLLKMSEYLQAKSTRRPTIL